MKEELQQKLIPLLKKYNASSLTVEVEQARHTKADYATALPLAVAKLTGQKPLEIAESMKTALEEEMKEVIIEITAPGFLNVSLPRTKIIETIETRAKGEFQTKKEGRVMLYEFMSPNLFKPLHVGNLVGAILGESLARIATYKGDRVTRLSYPSDIGLSVAKAVWGLQKTGNNPHEVEELGKAYQVGASAYETDEKARTEIQQVNASIYEENDAEITKLKEIGKKTSMLHAEELAKELGTHFDGYIFESEAAKIGEQIVKEKLKEGIFEKDEGAVVFRGEQYGTHTRVFLNAQGFPTYEAKELGNFFEKQKRYPKWEGMVVITGSEQKEYFQVLFAAMRKVFTLPEEKTLEHIANGFLSLTTGKMSTREGNVLTGEKVLTTLKKEALTRAQKMRTKEVEKLSNDIAVGALKYRILRQKTGGNIVFNLEQAFSFEGDSGPYLQYTFARTHSILTKAQENGIEASSTNPFEETTPLERKLYMFEEAVTLAYTQRSPHHLVAYLTTLAATFNTFYAKHRIISSNDAYGGYRVRLTEAVHHTLKKGLELLAIPTPEEF